jgi:hypothetical protein
VFIFIGGVFGGEPCLVATAFVQPLIGGFISQVAITNLKGA